MAFPPFDFCYVVNYGYSYPIFSWIGVCNRVNAAVSNQTLTFSKKTVTIHIDALEYQVSKGSENAQNLCVLKGLI